MPLHPMSARPSFKRRYHDISQMWSSNITRVLVFRIVISVTRLIMTRYTLYTTIMEIQSIHTLPATTLKAINVILVSQLWLSSPHFRLPHAITHPITEESPLRADPYDMLLECWVEQIYNNIFNIPLFGHFHFITMSSCLLYKSSVHLKDMFSITRLFPTIYQIISPFCCHLSHRTTPKLFCDN